MVWGGGVGFGLFFGGVFLFGGGGWYLVMGWGLEWFNHFSISE